MIFFNNEKLEKRAFLTFFIIFAVENINRTFATMKRIKIMAILCCLFSFLQPLAAQEDTIPAGRKWIMRRCNLVEPPMKESLYTAYILGSSTIDGYSYAKLRPGYSSGYNLVRREGSKWYIYKQDAARETLLFDESWSVGDTAWVSPDDPSLHSVVDDIGEAQGRKYWVLGGYFSGTWLQGVGFVDRYPLENSPLSNGYSFDLICCVEANGDTLYANRELFYMFDDTGVNGISEENVTVVQRGGECVVTLPYADAWSVTLYNSVGAAVARRSGEGSEIILPATSKGTHILVVNADGRVVKKKVFIK